MTDWKQVEELFLAAGELPQGDRHAFLVSACAGDETLLEEVESLLAHDSGGQPTPLTGIVRRSAASVVEAESLAGRRIGAYRIVGELGHGGMGSVYLGVRDDDQFHKKVAIKFIRHGMHSPGAIDRFLRERQILANLDHPNIAKLLDGGATDDGTPYFVMEYIAGTPVDEYCERRHLSVEQRCEMFRRICEGVSYAHRNLIVHRDLKPGNILVNAEGIPILLDFGIAKLLDGGAMPETNLTAGAWMLTPDYASPEQVRGLPATTASDIYSLGVVFYQLLTGAKPYHVDSTRPLELERAICETQPPRPSTMRRDRGLAGDLDNIVLMALRKEPERRYSSVEQFSEDVRRYLRRLPVIARDDTFGYRASKFVRRNRAGVLIGSLATAGLIAATIVTAREATRAQQARNVAEAERTVAVQQRQRAEQAQSVADRASASATARAQEAESERARAQKRLGELVELVQAALFHVQEKLEHVPGALDARRELIATTLEYLDGLSEESKNDPALLHLLSAGYTQIGDVLGLPGFANLGDRDGALAAYRKARAVIVATQRLVPEDVSAQLEDLGLHQRVGVIAESTGDTKTAVAEYRAALKIAWSVARQHPKDTKILMQPGMIEHSLGLALVKMNDPTAKDHVREEIRVYEAATALEPENPILAMGLAGAHANLARILTAEGNLPGTLAELRKAHAIREKLHDQAPNDALQKVSMAGSYERIALTLGAPWQPNMGDRAGAMEAIGKSIPLRMALYTADPSNRKAKADVAQVLTWAGAIEPDAALALPNLRRAATMLAELRAADPKQVTYIEQSALAHEYIGRDLDIQGNLTEAAAAYRESLAAKQNPAVAAALEDCERRLKRN